MHCKYYGQLLWFIFYNSYDHYNKIECGFLEYFYLFQNDMLLIIQFFSPSFLNVLFEFAFGNPVFFFFLFFFFFFFRFFRMFFTKRNKSYSLLQHPCITECCHEWKTNTMDDWLMEFECLLTHVANYISIHICISIYYI